jgi:hypothetical protein
LEDEDPESEELEAKIRNFLESEELDSEAWMKKLSAGRRMQVLEEISTRTALKNAEKAIQLLSTEACEHDASTWQAAAQWQLAFRQLKFADVNDYLMHFGYKLVDSPELASCGHFYQDVPSVTGPQLEVGIDGHIEGAGHTWYNLRCKLSRLRSGGCRDDESVEWMAPRRLEQLRFSLHHRVRQDLPSYDEHFGETRFAKTGGLPGTTARLKAWFSTLTTCINKGIAPPSLVTFTLLFLYAPLPEGANEPAGVGSAMAWCRLLRRLD